MDKKRIAYLALTTLMAISLTAFPNAAFAHAASKQLHMAGPATTTGANTIRNGKGAPTSSLGKNGDFYIDTLQLNFYGPKVSGRWPSPISMRGPAGAKGMAGKVGATGSKGSTGAAGATKAAIGAKGAQGVPGVKGATGTTGLTGPVGATGSTGATGSPGEVGATGRIGPNGLTGSPGAAGSNGSQGAPGATGSSGSVGLTGGAGVQGIQGATGLTGGTGAQGATGPSNVSMGTIGFPQILRAGSGASVASSAFGNFLANKQYFVHLLIYGVRSVTDFAPLRLTIYAIGGSPVILFNYLISDGRSYRTAIGENDTNLDVVVTADASSVLTPFQLAVTISSLDDTSIDTVTFAGSYVSELVGSIT